MRKTVFHEGAHWLHANGPDSYRDSVREYFHDLIAKAYGVGKIQDLDIPTALQPLNKRWGEAFPEEKGYLGFPQGLVDYFGSNYAMRVYLWELKNGGVPSGFEIPSMSLQALSQPLDILEKLLNFPTKSGEYAWRKMFFEGLKIFFDPDTP
jgi:hypothetical protein